MRATLRGCIAAAYLLFFGVSALGTEPAQLREPGQLWLQGVEQVGADDIRRALVHDFDVALASHPDASLSRYLRAVEASILLGYRHSGFRDATVAARYDEEQERIVVSVNEGDRHVCGQIKIDGAQHADTDALIRALSEPPKNDSTPWIKDRPAPFDDSTNREIRKRLKEAFAAQGLFSPAFVVQVLVETGTSAATLEIDIRDEGPRAEVGQITVSGNERDSDDDVRNYLDLRPGQPYDSGLAARLKACLDESGRFLGAAIDCDGAKRTIEDGREIVPLRIDLREYEHAPPLKGVFSAEQEALLKVRDWARRWAHGETEFDLVAEATFSAAAMAQLCAEMEMPMPPIETAGIERVVVRTVVSPQRGQTLGFRLFGPGGKLLFDQIAVFYPDRLILAAPQRRAKLELPFIGSNQTALTIDFRPAENPVDKPNDEGRRFQFLVGVTLRTKDHKKNGPLSVETRIAPAAALSFLESDEARCSREGDSWRLTRPGCVARLEAESGRLIEFRGQTEEAQDDGSGQSQVTIRTDKGAFDREARTLETQLAGMTAYDGGATWKSLIQWGLDEWLFALTQCEAPAEKVAAWKAIRKLVDRWSPPGRAESGFRDEEREAEKDIAKNDSWFELPWENQHWELDDFLKQPRSQSGRNAAAIVLAVYRRLVSENGWLWPVGRDLILTFASGEAIPIASLRRAALAADTGPVEAIVLASLKPLADEAVNAGLQHLSLDAFRHDYQPLMAGDSCVSKWILSLAEAVRSLDEADLRALLAAACQDEPSRTAARLAAVTIKQSANKPVAELISSLLDSCWESWLSTTVASQLKKRVPPVEVARRPSQAAAEASASLREEIEKKGGEIKSRSEVPETPVAKQLKELGLGEEKK